MPTRTARRSNQSKLEIPGLNFSPLDLEAFAGLPVPDPITFCLGPQWLAQRRLYPRQATLLKIIFLRDDLFTDYDHEVIAEWEGMFANEGDHGVSPGIYERIRINKQNQRKWFREVLLVMGRRAGKGHVSGLAMAYILWNYMAKGDPQAYYGISPTKKMECLIYAGKKEQARKNLYGDLVAAITDGPCFTPYISRPLGELYTVFAPADKLKMLDRKKRGLDIGFDQATFVIQPKEATLMSGRGGASFMLGFDEMAHVVASGANRSAEEIYGAATPSLDQFKKDAFIVEPSSPWQQTGQFYANWQNSIEMNSRTGMPEYANMLMIQLASWEIYKDWERAHEIDAFPRDFTGDLMEYLDAPLPKYPEIDSAFQTYDDDMKRLEKTNPETFKVERLSKWATTQDAYLDPDRVEAMWDENLNNKSGKRGRLDLYYKAHADPSSSGANFGLAIAHTEPDPNGSGFDICVFDYIHHWDPADFEDHNIDYITVVDELWNEISGYPVDTFTVDQFSSGPVRSMLKHKQLEDQTLRYKRTTLGEVTATAQLNWKKAENFKTALNQGWIKAPYYDLADKELRFLRQVVTATTMRVDKQETGPVTTKDVADCMFECVWALLGQQVEAMVKGLMKNPVTGGIQGGITPFSNLSAADESVFSRLKPGGGAARYQGAPGFGGSYSPARGIRRDNTGRGMGRY